MARSLIGSGLAALALALACGGSSEDGLFGQGGSAGSSGAAGAGGIGGAAGCAGASCAGSGGTAGDDGGAGAAGTSGGAGAAGSAGAGGGAGSAGSSGSAGSAGSAGSSGTGGSSGAGGTGGTPTPGSITCGAGPCALNFNVCCTCPGCTLPFPTQCYPKITGCTTGTPMHCDDQADCGGKVCCAHFQPPSYDFTGATCESKCPDEGNAQLCTTDLECPDGRKCKPLASLPGFKACQP